MITTGRGLHGSKLIGKALMEWSSELTLQGELITIKNENCKILALVKKTLWYDKTVVLQADGLNYDWAAKEAMKVYEHVRHVRSKNG